MRIRWMRLGAAVCASGAVLLWQSRSGESDDPFCPGQPNLDVPLQVDLDFPPKTSLTTWICSVTQARGLELQKPSDPSWLAGKKLTISSHQRLPPDAAWEALLSGLESYGLTLEVAGETATLARLPGRELSDPSLLVTQVFTLEHASAGEMAQILGQMMNEEGKVMTHSPTNALIVTDTPEHIRQIYKILKSIDVDSHHEPTMKRYPLQHVNASDARRVLEGLYTGGEHPLLSRVVSDEETHSLYVLAREDGHGKVSEVLAEMDKALEDDGENVSGRPR